MKDMIKRIREEREGFTLAELLIVVAIIAVLVAIAIPVFNAQLERAREGTDAANIRAAYAEVVTAQLSSDTTVSADADGVSYNAANGWYKEVTLEQTKKGWQDTSITKIGDVDVSDLISAESPKGTKVIVKMKAGETKPTIEPVTA